MNIKLCLAATAIASVLSLLWVFTNSMAQDSFATAGRYQQTAVFRQEGLDRIYVTVLDTATGEVVKLVRYDTGDYEKPESFPGKR